jgi:hypothetical protein
MKQSRAINGRVMRMVVLEGVEALPEQPDNKVWVDPLTCSGSLRYY